MIIYCCRKAGMFLLLSSLAVVGCCTAAAANDAGTVKVGLSTTLSGAIASLGVTGKHGIELAIKRLNDNGGLLGKKIELVSADDEATPANAVRNVRNFILSDGIKAIFGSVSSAVAAAEENLAAQYRVPIFFVASNDVDLTTKQFTKYAFQLVPNTYMESHSVAAYVAKRPWKSYYTISPNYSFGHSTVEQFLAGMKRYGADVNVVGQQWPKLGASDFSQYISAIVAKKPDALFVGQYGGDLITFTKQAQGYDLFQKIHVYAGYWLGTLQALGAKAPAGVITSSRAPFYLIKTQGMQRFTKSYHRQYHKWPSAWAVMAYSAVQSWAQGVKKAGSFDADKLVSALSGTAVNTIRGSFTLRACDHQAEVPEYVGVLSQSVDKQYGIRKMVHVKKVAAEKILQPCQKAHSEQQS